MIEGPIEVPDFNDASPSRDKPGHRNESGNGADLIDITEPVPRPQYACFNQLPQVHV
jgi:hypothetical protein